MAKPILPTEFRDDILNESMGGKRRYKMIENSDGTVSFEDVSTYDQVGSNFAAGQVNTIATAVNQSADSSKIIDDAETIDAVTEEGYIAGALAVKELHSSLKRNLAKTVVSGTNAFQAESIVTTQLVSTIAYSDYAFDYYFDLTVGAITRGTKTLLGRIVPEDARPTINRTKMIHFADGNSAILYIQIDGTVHLYPNQDITSERLIVSN